MSDEQQIRDLITRWAAAVHDGELPTVLADHAPDIVMFDVPPPEQGVRGLDAYRETWPGFFEWQASGAVFEIESLDITPGADVAFAFALLRCAAARPPTSTATPSSASGSPSDSANSTTGGPSPTNTTHSPTQPRHRTRRDPPPRKTGGVAVSGSARGTAKESSRGRPCGDRRADLPLVPEGVDNPAETPAVLIPNRRRLPRARRDRLRDDVIGVVDDKQSSARRAGHGLGAEALHARVRCGDPERRVADGQLRDDLIAVAHQVRDLRPERRLIEGNGCARALDPQLGLDARHPSEAKHVRQSGS